MDEQEYVQVVNDHLSRAKLHPAVQAELLDHLCCELETLLITGFTVERALAQVLADWPMQRLRHLRRQLYLTTKFKPMLIRVMGTAAVALGLLFILPLNGSFKTDHGEDSFHFSIPESAIENDTPACLLVQHPPQASPINGVELKDHISGFGWRIHPIYKNRMLHRGLDFRADTGTPVLATAAGEVIFAGEDGKHGIRIKIAHSDGYVTAYSHLSAYNVQAGDLVVLGEEIGAVGSTGASTGPHLHYEVIHDDQPVNPLALLE